MEKRTEDKMMIKVDENIFGKIKKFFLGLFNKNTKKDIQEENIVEEENTAEIIKEDIIDIKENENQNKKEYEDKEEIEKKLMNYYESIKNGI